MRRESCSLEDSERQEWPVGNQKPLGAPPEPELPSPGPSPTPAAFYPLGLIRNIFLNRRRLSEYIYLDPVLFLH
jgi:hypothetical protein